MLLNAYTQVTSKNELEIYTDLLLEIYTAVQKFGVSDFFFLSL